MEELLGGAREKIDEIDKELILLFGRRMLAVKEIAKLKAGYGLDVRDRERERRIIERAVSLADDGLREEAESFMRSVISISRNYQRKIVL